MTYEMHTLPLETLIGPKTHSPKMHSPKMLGPKMLGPKIAVLTRWQGNHRPCTLHETVNRQTRSAKHWRPWIMCSSARRSSSRLPELIELVLSRPLISSSMIQEALKVSKQGALNLVRELNLREMTGRGRFRAWGVV